MSNDRLYYIKSLNTWLTYTQAHEYGYTLVKAEEVTFYTSDLQEVTLRKDPSDNTFYDSREEAPHSWVSDINELESVLYKSLGNITIYQGEAHITCAGFTDSINSNELKYVYLDSEFVSIEDLYNLRGITTYKCDYYIVEDGIPLAWYDSDKELYWNNYQGYKLWQQSPPSPSAQPVDVSDFDILNIDLRPALAQYNLTQLQMSNIEFMKFGIDINIQCVDENMTVSDYEVLNIPIEVQLKLFNTTQSMQIMQIMV